MTKRVKYWYTILPIVTKVLPLYLLIQIYCITDIIKCRIAYPFFVSVKAVLIHENVFQLPSVYTTAKVPNLAACFGEKSPLCSPLSSPEEHSIALFAFAFVFVFGLSAYP